ncbi:hypothetical protein K9F09_11695 [Staphylococcus pseudintermedius]|nr:hypothetical protein K9F09_11695 [Staphylococcus pseudintermedius]
MMHQALMKSDIGVAMGSGSDIALESADIALVRNHLDGIADALQLSRLTIKNIKQNLFFAFCYNLIGIPIARSRLFGTLGCRYSDGV